LGQIVKLNTHTKAAGLGLVLPDWFPINFLSSQFSASASRGKLTGQGAVPGASLGPCGATVRFNDLANCGFIAKTEANGESNFGSLLPHTFLVYRPVPGCQQDLAPAQSVRNESLIQTHQIATSITTSLNHRIRVI